MPNKQPTQSPPAHPDIQHINPQGSYFGSRFERSNLCGGLKYRSNHKRNNRSTEITYIYTLFVFFFLKMI